MINNIKGYEVEVGTDILNGMSPDVSEAADR